MEATAEGAFEDDGVRIMGLEGVQQPHSENTKTQATATGEVLLSIIQDLKLPLVCGVLNNGPPGGGSQI